jgi:hypothetical protein
MREIMKTLSRLDRMFEVFEMRVEMLANKLF